MPESLPSLVEDVEIEIGGKLRHLRMDFRAIAAAERVTGKNLLRPGSVATAGASEMTAILWGCLLHEEPDLTLDIVRSWIHYGNAADTFVAVMDAVARCFPDPDDVIETGDDGAEDPTEAVQDGPKSGRSRGSSSKSRRRNSGD